MKKLILLTSLVALFVLSAVPALAQENGLPPDVTTDQYDPGLLPDAAAEQAVKVIIGQGKDADGAEAYAAALNAAREAGADQETAEVVAADAVADVSGELEMTELPDTGGVPVFALGAGLLVVGAGLLTRRVFL